MENMKITLKIHLRLTISRQYREIERKGRGGVSIQGKINIAGGKYFATVVAVSDGHRIPG